MLHILFFSPHSVSRLLSLRQSLSSHPSFSVVLLRFLHISLAIPLHPLPLAFSAPFLFLSAGSAPLACLALGLFAHPCCLVRITIQIALMPKTCDTSQEFAPVDWCQAVPQTSPRSVWFLLSSHCSSFPSPFILFNFPGPRSTDSFPLHYFTLSLFIYFTLSHRWPFVMSQTLCLPFSFPLPVFWFRLSFCVSVSGALLDIFRSLCVVILQRSVQGPIHLSQDCSITIMEL